MMMNILPEMTVIPVLDIEKLMIFCSKIPDTREIELMYGKIFLMRRDDQSFQNDRYLLDFPLH